MEEAQRFCSAACESQEDLLAAVTLATKSNDGMSSKIKEETTDFLAFRLQTIIRKKNLKSG